MTTTIRSRPTNADRLRRAGKRMAETLNFPGGGVPLSWSALREIVSTDLVIVGAHTHNREELGFQPDHFADPKAVRGSAYAESAIRSRYGSVAIAGTRANRPGDSFVQKAAGGMRIEDDFRLLINVVRYRGLTT